MHHVVYSEPQQRLFYSHVSTCACTMLHGACPRPRPCFLPLKGFPLPAKLLTDMEPALPVMEHIQLRALGRFLLRGLDNPKVLYQVTHATLRTAFHVELS